MAYNSDNTFVALIDRDGFVRDMSTGRRGEIVGVDYQKEEEYKSTIAEMQATLDNYYNKLVELGAITPPKTAEQIASEQLKVVQEQAEQQAKINQALLQAVEGLSAELKELKTNGNGRNDYEPCAEQNQSNSQSDGQAGKSSKSRASTGAKTTT